MTILYRSCNLAGKKLLTNSVFLKKLLESAGFSSGRLALVSAFDEVLA